MTVVLVVAETDGDRARLTRIVATRPAFRLAAAGAGRTLAGQVDEARAAVVLAALSRPRLDQLIREVARASRRGPAVVVLTTGADRAWTSRALRAGVRAILPREATADEIIGAMEAVASGLVAVHPDHVDALAVEPRRRGPAGAPDEALTARETEVLRMMAEGLANKVIAARLGISGHTAKFHVASIIGKLGAASRTEAVTIGIRRGVILI